jgi:effector-binding domain-containing protein
MTNAQAALDARIVQLAPQPTVAVRLQPAWETLDIGALFDHHIPQIARRLGALGLAPGGPPYARYHAFGPDGVDVELGFPVAAPPYALPSLAEVPPGDVGQTELPGGPAAVTTHVGGYEGLSATYDRLAAWIGAEGRAAAGGPWESYRDNPATVPADRLCTDICWPLA